MIVYENCMRYSIPDSSQEFDPKYMRLFLTLSARKPTPVRTLIRKAVETYEIQFGGYPDIDGLAYKEVLDLISSGELRVIRDGLIVAVS